MSRLCQEVCSTFVLGFPNKECTRWTYFFSAPDCALVHRQNRWTYEWRWCFDRNCAVGLLRWPVAMVFCGGRWSFAVVFCTGGGLLRWRFAWAVVFCDGLLKKTTAKRPSAMDSYSAGMGFAAIYRYGPRSPLPRFIAGITTPQIRHVIMKKLKKHPTYDCAGMGMACRRICIKVG